MDKTLAITEQQKSVLFNPEYNGFNMDLRTKVYPPVVNVLQSDKQFTSFPNSKPSDLVDHYGKLFVRNDQNTPDDLATVLSGTVIKIEQGHEVRDLKENKIVSSDARLLMKEEKAEYEEKGFKPVNMIKILLAIGTAKEVDEKMAIYRQKLLNGTATKADFPFAVVVIKGTSWGKWFETTDAMDKMAKAALGKSYRDVAATVFKFNVSSVKESGSFGDYYSLEVEPELNELEEAAKFAPYLLEMKEIGLFFKVGERVENERKVQIEKVFEGMEEKDGDVEEVEATKLPF